MPEPKDYYRTLQVDPSAEPEIVKAAYKRLALKYHPGTNSSSEAQERMREINEAYRILRDPANRAEYDKNRGSRTSLGGGETQTKPQ